MHSGVKMFVRWFLGSILLLSCSLGSALVHAKEVAGVDLEEMARLSVANTQLKLNGSAVRKEAQHAIYVGGLYLKNQASTLEEIINDPNPKRFLLYCSTAEISADKMIRAWQQGFAINNTPEQLTKLQPMIVEFNKIWDKGLKEGDEVWVDYVPEKGTIVSLNGDVISEIPSADFYHAFLKAWIGNHPFNSKIKEALLGK
jgi:hypothetical protein